MSTDTSEDAGATAAETATENEADASQTRTLQLASWSNRFFAWLIDIIVVGAILSVFGEVAGILSILTGSLSLTSPFLGLNGLGLWLYWTILEGSRGQSAGKMVLHIEVTDERGDPIDYQAAAIESFGKAFLLPIDCLIGWLAMEDEYVRLFNKLSSTIVIDAQDTASPPADVEYVKPGD